MAKTFIPQVGFKDVDLTPYGGEGIIRVKGIDTGTTARITSEMQRMAVKDGYSLNDLTGKKAEIDAKYNIPMMLLTISLRAEIVEDGVFRPITQSEVESLPTNLAVDLYMKIMEMNSFPLAQKDGEESKKEQSKPTSVE